ncbi:Glycerophosphoryl diester phosphodiesterase [Penicillium italicum]|uniref:Glycerophosphoryl diester phosphodiesterase n=1 Tax=Penicillium italicum TaxID=40296 RepID=A0A0A2LET3_PENIT|nr:Glycerophosphoryl diester phosphodiesterase [Penicillium italicum]
MLRRWDMSQLTGGPASILSRPVPAAEHRHRFETDQVIVNLGSLRVGNNVKAVDLKGLSPENARYTSRLASLDLSISVDGSDGMLLKLPILSNVVNEPFVFPVLRPGETSLIFKFFCADDSREGLQLVGSAAALLESGGDCFGANRESLVRERTIPILEKTTMEVMGTVTFTFIFARSVMNLNLPPSVHRYTTDDTLQLVGHRGLGQNTINQSRIQLGENTIESFLSAAKQGASCVEFDVQLTRDLVPVVYHDFSLSESGTDIPIHDLSSDQFMYANQLQSPRGIPTKELKTQSAKCMLGEFGREKPRSQSLTRCHAQETRQIQDRMKYTVDFMKKGLKPNTRGRCVQDSFTTLEQLLVELPESLSFNIEIKYPRLHEAVEAGVAPIAIEINTFIDEILAHISRSKSERRIMLSSFSPEVCILLAIKQNTYPVLFITNAGKLPISDLEIRASSLQAAVRFARRWDLAGIVFSSETLVMCPRLMGYVKNSGLICGSYGPLNNISENSKIQQEAGVQILMVDEVGYISKALNGTAN